MNTGRVKKNRIIVFIYENNQVFLTSKGHFFWKVSATPSIMSPPKKLFYNWIKPLKINLFYKWKAIKIKLILQADILLSDKSIVNKTLLELD
jgi:hypothetical protein